MCGAAAAVIGTTATAAGGGVLIVFGIALALLAAPAFVRYRMPGDCGTPQERQT